MKKAAAIGALWLSLSAVILLAADPPKTTTRDVSPAIRDAPAVRARAAWAFGLGLSAARRQAEQDEAEAQARARAEAERLRPKGGADVEDEEPGGLALAPKERQDALRAMLPKTTDEGLLALYRKHLIFYTSKEIPRSYQLEAGVHDIMVNVGNWRTRGEPFGNANREFPWGHPFGTHRCSPEDVSAFRFVHLPAPVIHWTESMSTRRVRPGPGGGGRTHSVRRWEFPQGTVFGEVLLVKEHVFEVRTRSKDDKGKWQPNVYRPVLTREEYDRAVRELGGDPGEPKVEVRRLKDGHPDRRAFDETAAIDVLSPQPEGIVEKLLSRPFRQARGKPWIVAEAEGETVEGHAPSSDSRFHIVPKDYDGGAVKVDQQTCMKCHQDVKEREAGDFDLRRDWYGRVRGDDGIFSFSVFDPKSISKGRAAVQVRLDGRLVDAGLLKHWKEVEDEKAPPPPRITDVSLSSGKE